MKSKNEYKDMIWVYQDLKPFGSTTHRFKLPEDVEQYNKKISEGGIPGYIINNQFVPSLRG